MRTRVDHQRDTDDQDALFQKVIGLLDAQRAADPTIMEVARLSSSVLLGRRGNLLFFQRGSGRRIGFGQIVRNGDSPRRLHELAIVRSKKSPSLFQLNDGPGRDLEVIAVDIVESFLR